MIWTDSSWTTLVFVLSDYIIWNGPDTKHFPPRAPSISCLTKTINANVTFIHKNTKFHYNWIWLSVLLTVLCSFHLTNHKFSTCQDTLEPFFVNIGDKWIYTHFICSHFESKEFIAVVQRYIFLPFFLTVQIKMFFHPYQNICLWDSTEKKINFIW